MKTYKPERSSRGWLLAGPPRSSKSNGSATRLSRLPTRTRRELSIVVLDAGDRKIEVLHPCIDGGIRIDVWLRTVSELRHLEVVIGQGGRMDENPFVLNAIETGKVLKDFHGTLQRLQDTLRSKKAK